MTKARATLMCFYSRLVRLKVNLPSGFRLMLTSFYSRLVRLKAGDDGDDGGKGDTFLFQTGSIKSDADGGECFGVGGVSIPDWFD